MVPAVRQVDFPTRRTALPAWSVSGLLNGSVVRVTAAHAAVFARSGAAGRPAARLVWSVLMDNPGCLTASPDPHHVTRCDSPSTRFHAGHCGGRGVPRGSRPQPCQFRRPVSWWRALRAWGTPGQDCPGTDMSPRATDWRLHAREPPVPAQCGLFTANEAFQPLGDTPHYQIQRGGPVCSTPGASSGAARYRGGALHASPIRAGHDCIAVRSTPRIVSPAAPHHERGTRQNA